MFDIELAHAFDKVLGRRHVAHGAERVDIHAHRMDDVVDAVLDDHVTRPCHIHLDGETRFALQAVGLVGDAVVLAQDARAAHGTSNDRHVMPAVVPGTIGKVVGPALCRDGVAIAHQRMVLLLGQDVDGVEKVEPVGVSRQVKRQHLGIGVVTIRELALRQWPRHQRARIHLRITAQVNAYLDDVARIDCQRYLIALHFPARSNVHTSGAIESDGHRSIVLHHLRHTHLGECHLLGAREVREAETQLAAAETHSDGISQRDVTCVHRHLAVRYRRGIAPASHPFGIFVFLFLHRHSFSVQS